MDFRSSLKQLAPYLYEIPLGAAPNMRVPAYVYISETLLEEVAGDRSLEQLVNVSTLPGIVKYALAMPDMHEGYGFPIGGVAAMVLPNGIISPGGVGYDINCGVRLLISDLTFTQISPSLEAFASEVMRAIPSGTGRGGRIRLSPHEMDEVLRDGAQWCLKVGKATPDDIERLEERGRMAGADPTQVGDRAKKRGHDQLGTIGSGNHFLEIQKVEQVFDEKAAKAFGLFRDQIVIAVHCGSRGLGHQICTDHVRVMLANLEKNKIVLSDRELACAPADSPEGRSYLAAMACAANFAWANRQVITHHTRIEWAKTFGAAHKLGTLYDVCHNIAKKERHEVDGKAMDLLVHRKGATRAFGPGRAEVPAVYREIGQPVLIPGTMGTASYVLKGTEEAMKKTFGTVCHGAGRRLSRHAAKRQVSGQELKKDLEEHGIVVRCFSNSGLAEEAPLAYKDVDEVVKVVEQAGLSARVARLRPVAVIKGE